MFQFYAPLWLLLLVVPAALTMLLVWRQPREPRQLAALALRLLAMVLLIGAVAQPEWRGQSAGSSLGILVDTSASLSAADRANEAAWVQQASALASATTPVTVMRFAGATGAVTLHAPISKQNATRLVQPGNDALQTDLASALQLASDLLPAGSTVVLLSDGKETTGSAGAVVSDLTARKIVVDTVLLNQQPRDVALTRLTLPASAKTGTTVPLQLTIQSTQPLTVTVALSIDGHSLGNQALGVQAGANPYLINLPSLAPGQHIVHASVTAPGDGVPQNNALDAVTDITGTPRVLLVATKPEQSSALALLQRSSLTIVADTPQAMPATAAALEGYDGIVLDDLPATDLTPKQVAALSTSVRTTGVGLFVLGGTHSLTQGHYSQTALENLLPVLSDTPASLQNGNVALQLVLDRSGSMNDLAGDEPKILMSRSAADIAVDFAEQHKDDLGVVSFDYYTHLLFPMQAVTTASAKKAHTQIAGMTANGGTNIYAGLRLGIQQVLKSNAPYHHIILMTDGRSDPADYTPLLQEAQRDKITISTLALGADADTQLLHWMAALGKGRFYATNNASDLPHIFAEEARLSAGSAAVNGTIAVQVATSSPAIRSLGSGPLADLSGYTATVLKPGAVNDLETDVQGRQPDPLLAQWHYGLGRVLVWTPGVENTWSATWRQSYPTFWSDAVEWVLRGAHVPEYAATVNGGAAPDAIEIDTVRNSGILTNLQQLALTVHVPGGTTSQLLAAQTGPGLYMAPFQFTATGVYTVTVQPINGSTPTTTALAVPYSAEYLPGAPDGALLGSIAAATSGRALHGSATLAALPRPNTGTTALWWIPALAALIVFLIAIATGRFLKRATINCAG